MKHKIDGIFYVNADMLPVEVAGGYLMSPLRKTLKGQGNALVTADLLLAAQAAGCSLRTWFEESVLPKWLEPHRVIARSADYWTPRDYMDDGKIVVKRIMDSLEEVAKARGLV